MHSASALDCNRHGCREPQHVDDHDDGCSRGDAVEPAESPVEPDRRAVLLVRVVTYHSSQCRMLLSGSRLAGLKSVPIV